MDKKFIAVAAVALCIAAAGCGAKKSGGWDQAAAGQPKVGEPGGSVPVQVASVDTGDMEKTVAVTGNLAALDDVELSPKTSGRVVSVAAREGDAVRAGQVVVQLDTVDLDANVRQAQ